MKENAIKKINTMGKVGTVFALIAKIFVSMLLGISIIAFVAFLVLPADLCTVKVDGKAKIGLDLSAFGVEMDAETRKEVEQGALGQSIAYDDNYFLIDSIVANEHGFVMHTSGSMTELNIRDLALLMVGAVIYLIILLISTIFAGRLAKAFRNCESPFEENVITRIKQFAYSLIPWAVVSSVVASLRESMLSSYKHITLNFDLGTIIIVLVILALAYIFQYGAVLQKESDETL